MHQSVHCHARESRKGTPESRTRVFRLQCCNVRLSGTSAPSNKETELFFDLGFHLGLGLLPRLAGVVGL
jgi:hypothetical protein